MGQDNNTVILQVKLDEGKTEEQLRQLVLDIEATRKAQAALTAERKAGTVADDVFAQKVVELKTQLKSQQGEQTALTKNLELYRTAVTDTGGSYVGLQAQLSLAQRQFQQLDGSANNSGESAKALGATIDNLRSTLKATDETQGLFVRNIGNYPKGESIAPLIQQLVHLQEVQKALPAGSDAAVEAQKRIGFQFGQVNAAAASAGLSQAELTNKLKDYGERIRPAEAELAKLVIAQDAVAKSTGKESEEFVKIGFQIGKTQKAIAAIPPELAKVPTAADQAASSLKATGTALEQGVTKGLGLFGAQTEKATSLLGKFKSGTDLVTSGLSALKGGGETGALGIRTFGAALASVGIGVVLLALSALVGYFTQTNEGSKLLKQGLAALGAVVTTVSNLIFGAGKAMVEAFKNPKQALDDLVGFLKSQVINRLTSFSVILEGIEKRDFKKIANGIIQFNTGITNGIDKVQAYAAGVGKVALSAAELEAQQQKLKKSRAELEASEILEKGRVEELIRLSKDRTLSASDRLGKLREAGKMEGELSAKSLKQISDELSAIKQRNAAKGLSKTSDEIQEERDKQKEYNNTVVERNNTLATIKARQSRFILEEAAELKKAQDARKTAAQKAREDAIRDRITDQKNLLLATQQGSAAELVIKQQIIQLEAELEIAGAKKTAAEKKLIQGDANVASKKLQDDFDKKAIEEAKKRTAAQVAEQKREFEESAKLLNDYITDKRAQVERDYAAGLISENQYQKQLNALEKAGLEAQAVVNKDYSQDNAKVVRGQADLEIKEANRVKEERKKIKEVEQQIVEASLQATLAASDAVIDAFGKESEAGKFALGVKKTLALADIGISLQKTLIANTEAGKKISALAPPLTIPLGIAYTVAEDALAIASSAAAAAKILGFKDGGVLVGPRHEEGGIPFTVAGRPGFEAEGGEIILTRGVWDSPILRPMASALNVMGGGAPLMPRAHMALGGVAAPLVREQLRGNVAQGIDYNKLAQSLQKVKIYTRTSDTKAALERDAYTQSLSNF